jgi:hypothetical protein
LDSVGSAILQCKFAQFETIAISTYTLCLLLLVVSSVHYVFCCRLVAWRWLPCDGSSVHCVEWDVDEFAQVVLRYKCDFLVHLDVTSSREYSMFGGK